MRSPLTPNRQKKQRAAETRCSLYTAKCELSPGN
jgi:hypothetical protein